MVKKEKGAIESCRDLYFGTGRDCCKIVILGIKCEYLSYHHFSWRILLLEVSNS